MVTVIQSVYGGYDYHTKWMIQTARYNHLYHDPARPHLHPRMAAKVAKCRPWAYSNDDILIWVDGSIIPTDNQFIEHLVDSSHGPISQYRHPHRDCILPEAKVSAGMLKYEGQPVAAQAAAYIADGHPRHWGLWATGIIVYRPKPMYPLQPFGDAWLAEQCAWTYQDQISEPYLLHKMGLRPHTIPGDIFHMDHAVIRPHTSDD